MSFQAVDVEQYGMNFDKKKVTEIRATEIKATEILKSPRAP